MIMMLSTGKMTLMVIVITVIMMIMMIMMTGSKMTTASSRQGGTMLRTGSGSSMISMVSRYTDGDTDDDDDDDGDGDAAGLVPQIV